MEQRAVYSDSDKRSKRVLPVDPKVQERIDQIKEAKGER
jgi:hypothetical protein